jgi:hypothetical protein
LGSNDGSTHVPLHDVRFPHGDAPSACVPGTTADPSGVLDAELLLSVVEQPLALNNVVNPTIVNASASRVHRTPGVVRNAIFFMCPVALRSTETSPAIVRRRVST